MIVGGSRVTNNSRTGECVCNDSPKSPRNTPLKNLQYWDSIEPSRPNLLLNALISSRVAASPRSESTGSPGLNRRIPNAMRETPNEMSTAWGSRARTGLTNRMTGRTNCEFKIYNLIFIRWNHPTHDHPDATRLGSSSGCLNFHSAAERVAHDS